MKHREADVGSLATLTLKSVVLALNMPGSTFDKPCPTPARLNSGKWYMNPILYLTEVTV